MPFRPTLAFVFLALGVWGCSLGGIDPSESSGSERAESSPSPSTPPVVEETSAEETPAESSSPQDFWDALNALHQKAHTVNKLRQIQDFQQLAVTYGQDPQQASYLASLLAESLCTAGDYAGAHEAYDAPRSPRKPAPKSTATQIASLEGFEARDALTVLAQATEDQQVVMINEAHHVPQHRTLSLQLLPILKQQGFSHFAAETLSEFDTSLAERGYPTSASGYYTEEPLYGDLVRTALRLGFQLVAYDLGGAPSEREPGQASNLVSGILEENPDARIFIHLGYAHNRESVESFGGVGAMAYHFKNLTGIDPLTIDQTLLTENSDPVYEPEFYRHLAESVEHQGPTAFVGPEGEIWALARDDRDIALFHPRTQLGEHGRPTWLAMGGLRQAVALPDAPCGDAPECLVEARYQEEGDDAIPVDRLILRTGSPTPSLMLPVGTFRVTIEGVDGTELHASEVTVSG